MNPLHTVSMRKRRLAIVLLDIIGSTAFVTKVGDVRASRWFNYHDQLTRNLVIKYNGREIDRSDGFLLSFESIIDAVNFSLVYQDTIPNKTRLNTRIGIHWGDLVEVKQDELWVGVGAKRIELEGITKNIAARTMSLCGPRQVLMTKEAYRAVRGRANMFTPKTTMYACVGMYKFKGVKEPQVIYAVGTDISRIQPPPSSEKAKRLGGPKYIKLKARDRKIKDWLIWAYKRLTVAAIIFTLYIIIQVGRSPLMRDLLGLQSLAWIEIVYDYTISTVSNLWGEL